MKRRDMHSVLLRSAIGPLWARWERSPYLRLQKALRQTQFDDRATIEARQWVSIRRLLRHAATTVPYYRRAWAEAGILPDSIRNLDDFRRIPVLTKADLRESGETMISSLYDRAKLIRKKTSGSTGVSLQVLVDEPSMQFKRACTLRADEWSGWRFGEPVAMVWGNPDYLRRGWRGRFRNSVLDRAAYLDTLKMDEAALARFAHRLVRRPPSLIFGHAHSVYLFAEFARQQGITAIRPRGIITTAMILHDWQRQAIEQAFACKVTNRYGCEEVSLIACECECHEGLHVNSDSVYVEILRDGQPAAPGEEGSVVVTDLTNRGMPILRYQVGDVSAWAESACSCGRGLPLLKRVEGREADYVTTRSGDLISGISLTENFAMLIPGIAQLQIVQETVDRFLFRIVRSPEFVPASFDRIAELVSKRFGPDATYECEFVESIPQEPSGKYRFCISRVPNAFTRGSLSEVSTS